MVHQKWQNKKGYNSAAQLYSSQLLHLQGIIMERSLFIRTVMLTLLFTVSFFSRGETTLRLAYAENSQPVKDALHFFGQQVEEKTGVK